MSIADNIYKELELLPEDKQAKVLDFIKLLSKKQSEEEIEEWNKLSLHFALDGIEDDDVEYTIEDIKEKYIND